jgi:hypothetical protein
MATTPNGFEAHPNTNQRKQAHPLVLQAEVYRKYYTGDLR